MGASEVAPQGAGLHADGLGDVSHRQPGSLPDEGELIGEVFSGGDPRGIGAVRSFRVVSHRAFPSNADVRGRVIASAAVRLCTSISDPLPGRGHMWIG